MIYSMTGFGRAEHDFEEYNIVAEVRSVNSRYLDVNMRVPDVLSAQEYVLKKVVQDYCTRGQLSVRVYVNTGETSWTRPVVNQPRLQQYREVLQEMQDTLDLNSDFGVSDLLQLPDLISFEEDLPDQSVLFERATAVLQQALTELKTMRKAEGETLKRDFLTRLEELGDILEQIQELATANSGALHDSLYTRIETLLGEVPVDKERLAQELAYLAEKVDTTEEIVRFQSHIDQFQNLLGDGDTIGKRLNFLLQEMNREINTIGAKSNNSDISHLVVDVKNELEKLREQVQNIE